MTSFRRTIVYALGLCLLFIAVLAVLYLFRDVEYNFHAVIPGKVYRSAELHNPMLLRIIKKYHIKSILNLRNAHPREKWYQNELKDAQQNGAKVYNISMPSHQKPTPEQLTQLVNAVLRAPYPMLIHCRHGADRTGLAAALVLLLRENKSYAAADEQVSIEYFALSPKSVGRLVLPQYHAWLKAKGLTSTRGNFLTWMHVAYR